MDEPADTDRSPDELLVRISPHPARPSGGEQSAGGKRAAITRAATALFLQQGYQATSTEQIASAAAVSKQTVYNQFGDKQNLFREIVLGVTATAEAFAGEVTDTLRAVESAGDVEPTLRALARRYLAAVMNPQVLALRRLIIGEAGRFPDLAAAYYDRAPARMLDALSTELARLAERRLLAVPEPRRAAVDFAYLLLGHPLDAGMFHGPPDDTDLDATDLDATADHAVDVFLAAYRRGRTSGRSSRSRPVRPNG